MRLKTEGGGIDGIGATLVAILAELRAIRALLAERQPHEPASR